MDSRTIAHIRIRSLEARLVNSRKVSVRAELESEIACYRSGELSLTVGMEGEEAVQLRREEAEVMPVSDVREKTFAVTDEYAFPSGCGPQARILSRRAEIVTEDVQFVGGKVVFRGRVRSELLLGGSDDGKTFVGRYETEFSQIMEMDAPSGDALPELSLFFTGVYFDLPEYGDGNERIQAEMHMAAQCVCREKRVLTYVSDIYSNRTELVPQLQAVEYTADVRAVSMRQTVADRIEGTPCEGELLRATATVGAVTAEGGAVRATVNVRLLWVVPDGGVMSVRGRLHAEFTLSELSDGDTLRDVSVTVADVYCVPGTGDVRVSLRLDALAEKKCELSCVGAVTEDLDAWNARGKMPSAVLTRVPSGADLWQLARRYRSTVEDILTVNEGRTEGLLLIPKGR